jgi:4-hydroxybenzoate polyprenyltransferase
VVATSAPPRVLLALAIVHPVPSTINATLVASLAVVAGGSVATAVLLAMAMLGFQFSIGALNDIVDAAADRRGRRHKPIPTGVISTRTAGAAVLLGAAAGIVISASFGLLVLSLGLGGYACGVAYDVVMRRRGLGWLCFAAAFPLLLAWTWIAAAATLPPGWPFLLPVAALAGPALHLANSLVDVGTDRHTDRHSLATQLGVERARRTLATLMAAIVGLVWTTLWSLATVPPLAGLSGVCATVAIAIGVGLSWQRSSRAREIGWLLQAVGLSALAAAWLATMVAA